MTLFVTIIFSKLSEEGKSYNWGFHFCDQCERNMWGHGYVQRIFSSYNRLWLKRYRCPECGIVVTTRPTGYWNYFQSSIEEIYEALIFRFKNHFWSNSDLRQRYGHWLRSFNGFHKMNGLGQELISFLNTCYLKQLPFLS